MSNYREKIKSEQEGIKYDPDSSPEAWVHYSKFYTPKHWGLRDEFDFENRDTRNNLLNENREEKEFKRLLSLVKPTSKYAKSGKFWSKFNIGGDADFNFNDEKFELFRGILGNNKEALLQLAECHKYHHSLVNFSLMPATGSLNNYKGSNRFDRQDTFIKDLNYFFSSNSRDILSEAGVNEEPLENFLNTFDNIYHYCEKFYFIDDREFIDRMISEGAMPITTRDDVVRYMNLAMDFWKKKEKYFEDNE